MPSAADAFVYTLAAAPRSARSTGLFASYPVRGYTGSVKVLWSSGGPDGLLDGVRFGPAPGDVPPPDGMPGAWSVLSVFKMDGSKPSMQDLADAVALTARDQGQQQKTKVTPSDLLVCARHGYARMSDGTDNEYEIRGGDDVFNRPLFHARPRMTGLWSIPKYALSGLRASLLQDTAAGALIVQVTSAGSIYVRLARDYDDCYGAYAPAYETLSADLASALCASVRCGYYAAARLSTLKTLIPEEPQPAGFDRRMAYRSGLTIAMPTSDVAVFGDSVCEARKSGALDRIVNAHRDAGVPVDAVIELLSKEVSNDSVVD